MSEWILTRFPLTESDTSDGFDVPFELIVDSPYALPDAIRCARDPDDGAITIEFRYMDGPEPTIRGKDLEPGVSIRLGKYSRRIQVIELDEEKSSVVDNIEFVVGLVAAAAGEPQAPDRKGLINYRELGQAMKSRGKRLNRQLVS